MRGDVPLEEPKEAGIRFLKQQDNPQINDPNSYDVRTERIYSDALTSIPAGRGKNAHAYHHLMTAIIIKLFMPPLHSPSIETEIEGEQQRIDIVTTNHAERGFFYHISESYDIHAPFVFVECKNYLPATKIANEEVFQLSGRFSEKRGRFGDIDLSQE